MIFQPYPFAFNQSISPLDLQSLHYASLLSKMQYPLLNSHFIPQLYPEMNRFLSQKESDVKVNKLEIVKPKLTLNITIKGDPSKGKPIEVKKRKIEENWDLLCYEDLLQKKVKIDETESHASTQGSMGDLHDNNSMTSLFSHNFNKSAGNSPIKTVNNSSQIYLVNETKSKKTKKNKQKKIVGIVADHKTEGLLYKVEYEGEGAKYLERDEVLQEDPLMLLYFYENSLQFKKAKEFQGSKLKQLMD